MAKNPLNLENDSSEEEGGQRNKISRAEIPNKSSLYFCSLEWNRSLDGQKCWGAYVVRAINLSDLLSSSSASMKLEWRQVGYRAGEDLSPGGGCGVLGSQIVFAGGLKRSYMPIDRELGYDSSLQAYGYDYGPEAYGHDSIPQAYGYYSSRQVYAYDTKESKHEIVTMDGTVEEGKHDPLMAEVAGKLYALSGKPYVRPHASFEVFDPTHGDWSLLPEPPYVGGNLFSYAVVGTKFFVSNENSPVFCFDVAAAAHPAGWKTVPSMCQGGSFPFLGKALVLDLPEQEHHNRKIMFTATNFDDSSPRGRRRLLVYLMSLYENQESITPIHELQLPELPEELPYESSHYHFLHLGGRTVCLVITGFQDPDEDEPYEPGTHNISGAAIPFQFDFDISMVDKDNDISMVDKDNDISMVDKDKKNCFTVQFLPYRILEYHTNPSSLPDPDTLGCFVL